MRTKVLEYDADPDKENRINKCLCRRCYYTCGDTWAGQAFTDSKCDGCGKEMTFATTDTDDYCEECAKKYNVCKHCSAAMD
jgi:hypothetical protein